MLQVARCCFRAGVRSVKGSACLRCNMLRLALRDAIKMFLLLCCDCPCGLSAGGMGGPDRQETGGLSVKPGGKTYSACMQIVKDRFF